MEIKKFNLDRPAIPGEYIESKQNFKEVLYLSKLSKASGWKSPLFYGAMGLSSATIAVVLSGEIKNEITKDLASKNSSEYKINKLNDNLKG